MLHLLIIKKYKKYVPFDCSLALAICAAVMTVYDSGYTRLYKSIDDYGIWYLFRQFHQRNFATGCLLLLLPSRISSSLNI